MIEIWFDGSCYPNPGKLAIAGTVIKDNGATIFTNSETLDVGDNLVSNNCSEYQGLINGLGWVLSKKRQAERILVYGDSNMVINQSSGKWRISVKGKKYYREYAHKCRELIPMFSQIKFKWIPREYNVEADLLTKPTEDQLNNLSIEDKIKVDKYNSWHNNRFSPAGAGQLSMAGVLG